MSSTAVQTWVASRWLPLGAAVAATLAIYAPVVANMAAEWAKFPSLSHGFAVPIISAYLLWTRREAIAVEPFDSSLAGLAIFVCSLVMLVTGSLGGEPFIARLSFPLALMGVVLFLAGPRVIRHAWMSLAFLTFMIPLPYVTLKALTYQARLFDASVTAAALRRLRVPVFQDGVMLYLPDITLEVADDCSSVPAIAALMVLGAAYAQVHPRPGWARIALTLAAVPLGLAANLVRLILTSVAAYYLGRIALDNVIHRFSGTSVFMATVVLLIVLDSALNRISRRSSWSGPAHG